MNTAKRGWERKQDGESGGGGAVAGGLYFFLFLRAESTAALKVYKCRSLCLYFLHARTLARSLLQQQRYTVH